MSECVTFVICMPEFPDLAVGLETGCPVFSFAIFFRAVVINAGVLPG